MDEETFIQFCRDVRSADTRNSDCVQQLMFFRAVHAAAVYYTIEPPATVPDESVELGRQIGKRLK